MHSGNGFQRKFRENTNKLFHFQYDPYSRLGLTFGKRPFFICIFELTYVYNSVYCLSLPITQSHFIFYIYVLFFINQYNLQQIRHATGGDSYWSTISFTSFLGQYFLFERKINDKKVTRRFDDSMSSLSNAKKNQHELVIYIQKKKVSRICKVKLRRENGAN